MIDVGGQLFIALPYEQVLMKTVAEQAGVSRALMYRYFPTKREFFAAIFQ
jgi:AcrR family transcriptional regulator